MCQTMDRIGVATRQEEEEACNHVKSNYNSLFIWIIKSSKCLPFRNAHVSSVYKIVIKNAEVIYVNIK